MKKSILALIIPVLLMISSTGHAWVAGRGDPSFVADQEHFSALFPGKVTAFQNNEKTVLGALGENIYTSEEKGVFTVEYSILPVIQADLGDPDEIYDMAVKDFLARKGATQVSLNHVSVQGYTGKQLAYKTSDGTPGSALFIKAGRNFYVVSATTPYGSWARNFLASFKIL